MKVEVTPQAMPLLKAAVSSLVVAAGIGLFLVPMIVADPRRQASEDEAFVILICSFVVSLAVAAACFLLLRQKGGAFAGTLSLEQNCIRWQPESGQIVEVPYAALWTAAIEGRDGSEALVLKAEHKGQAIVLSAKSLGGLETARALLAEILNRVKDLSEAEPLLAQLDKRQALVERLAAGSRVAPAIVLILVCVFLVEIGVGALKDSTRMLSLGANSPDLVAKGEVFRLATSNLLHAGLAHLMINLLSLWVLSLFLEPLLGRARFLTMFLATAIAGASLSAWAGQHYISVGASTGILGLYAARVALEWRWRDQLSDPPESRWTTLLWVFLVLFSGGKRVDHLGHLGGFLAGCILMLPAFYEADVLKLHARNRSFFLWTSILLVVIYLAACSMIPLVKANL